MVRAYTTAQSAQLVQINLVEASFTHQGSASISGLAAPRSFVGAATAAPTGTAILQSGCKYLQSTAIRKS